jgi:serine/threonine protein kinase
MRVQRFHHRNADFWAHALRVCFFSLLNRPTHCQDEIDALEAGDDVKTYLARLNPAPAADLSQKFPHADKQALTILSGMLTFLASERLTFDQALDNPFLASAETPDDVQDETSVNFAPVGLVRKSSNLAVRRPAHDAHSPHSSLPFISFNLLGCSFAFLVCC